MSIPIVLYCISVLHDKHADSHAGSHGQTGNLDQSPEFRVSLLWTSELSGIPAFAAAENKR